LLTTYSVGGGSCSFFLYLDSHAEPSKAPPFASNDKAALTSLSHYNTIQKRNMGVKLGVFYGVKIPSREHLLPQSMDLFLADPPTPLHDLKWFS
jgi:hypothetical protein